MLARRRGDSAEPAGSGLESGGAAAARSGRRRRRLPGPYLTRDGVTNASTRGARLSDEGGAPADGEHQSRCAEAGVGSGALGCDFHFCIPVSPPAVMALFADRGVERAWPARAASHSDAARLQTRASSVRFLAGFFLLMHWCVVPLLSDANAINHVRAMPPSPAAPRGFAPWTAWGKPLMPALATNAVALRVRLDSEDQTQVSGTGRMTIAAVHPSLVALKPDGSALQVEKAVRVGDEITSVDDTPAWQLGPIGVQALFREAGENALRITVRAADAPPGSPHVALLIQLVKGSSCLPGDWKTGRQRWGWVHSVRDSPDACADIIHAIQVFVFRVSGFGFRV